MRPQLTIYIKVPNVEILKIVFVFVSPANIYFFSGFVDF